MPTGRSVQGAFGQELRLALEKRGYRREHAHAESRFPAGKLPGRGRDRSGSPAFRLGRPPAIGSSYGDRVPPILDAGAESPRDAEGGETVGRSARRPEDRLARGEQRAGRGPLHGALGGRGADPPARVTIRDRSRHGSSPPRDARRVPRWTPVSSAQDA